MGRKTQLGIDWRCCCCICTAMLTEFYIILSIWMHYMFMVCVCVCASSGPGMFHEEANGISVPPYRKLFIDLSLSLYFSPCPKWFYLYVRVSNTDNLFVYIQHIATGWRHRERERDVAMFKHGTALYFFSLLLLLDRNWPGSGYELLASYPHADRIICITLCLRLSYWVFSEHR